MGEPREFPIPADPLRRGMEVPGLAIPLGKRNFSQKFLDFSRIFRLDGADLRRTKFQSSLKFPRGSRIRDVSRGIGMGAGNGSRAGKKDEDPGIPGSGMWGWNSSNSEGARGTWRKNSLHEHSMDCRESLGNLPLEWDGLEMVGKFRAGILGNILGSGESWIIPNSPQWESQDFCSFLLVKVDPKIPGVLLNSPCLSRMEQSRGWP